jgi:serine/threonine protein kinase
MSDFVQISQTSDDLDLAEGLKRDEDIATSRGSPIEEKFSSNIDISKLSVGEEVGHGNFASVYKGTYGDKKQLVAIKKQSLEDPELLKYVLSEIDILKNIEHPNVLNYIGICHLPKENNLYIITEFLDGGDLRDFILSQSKLGSLDEGNQVDTVGNETDWRLRTKIVMDVANAIYYLHSHNLMHRDIKTDNVILSSDQRFVLCDFGFATYVFQAKRKKTLSSEEFDRPPQRTMSFCGTDEFMSPEQMFGMRYGFPSDIFSFGILIAEVISGKVPGVDGHLTRYPQNGFSFEDDEELRNMMPKNAPYSLVELCVQCCAAEPDDRPTAFDAYEWAKELYDELNGNANADEVEGGDSENTSDSMIYDEIHNDEKSTSTVTPVKGPNEVVSQSVTLSNSNATTKTTGSTSNSLIRKTPSKTFKRIMGNKRRSSVILAEFDGRTFDIDLGALELKEVVKRSSTIVTHEGVYNENAVFVKIIKFDTKKLINQKDDSNSKNDEPNFFKEELDSLKTLSHINLVKYFGAAFNVDEGNLYLCMEYLSGGTLHDFLVSKRGGLNKTFPWTLKLHFASELVSAIKHLHNRDLVHRDIRSSKIMLSKGMRLVINYCSIWNNSRYNNEGDDGQDDDRKPFYAPEIFERKNRLTKEKFSFATDIFSVGLILLEIGSGKSISKSFPKRDANNNYSIYNAEILGLHTKDGVNDAKNETISRSYYDICTQACQFSPVGRPTGYELHEKLAELCRSSHTATGRTVGENKKVPSANKKRPFRHGRTIFDSSLSLTLQPNIDVKTFDFMKTGEYGYAGILFKRGRWNPQWKCRAFAIRKSAIDYFRYNKTKSQQIGSLPFDSLMVFDKNKVATTVPNKIRLFKLCTQKRTYHLQAGDEQKRDQWIHEINSAAEAWRKSIST